MASNQPTFIGFEPQMQDISRQRDLAKMLLQKGMTDNLQGQMVSGRYVGASPLQGIANIYSAYKGKQLAEESDKKQADLAQKLRQLQVTESQDILSALQGKPEVASVIPEGQTLRDDQGQLTMGSQAGTPAVAGSTQAALAAALKGQSPFAQTMATKLMERQFKEPNWKEITKYNQETGNTETYRYDANLADPTPSMQFLGVSKPALSRAEQIRFADEGINPNIGGVSAPVVGGKPVVGSQSAINTQVSPTAATETNAPVAKPTEPSTKEYNYFKAPPPPAGLSGKQSREFVSEQNKPLTGKANDTVNGAIGYQKSLDKLVNLFGQYSGTDMLKPNVKAEFKGALRTAQLQGKEAFGLGVLNGPDLEILEQVLVDPTAFDAFLKDRATINKLYNNQREFTSDAIKTNYRSAQKAVPENLREYVEIKPIELKTETKPSATSKTQRAVLNGENIVVKNGKWVYERTGKAVE
jgi:hypothetical protein